MKKTLFLALLLSVTTSAFAEEAENQRPVV